MKATVTVHKTLQESQFEPFGITLTIEKEIIVKREIEKLYNDTLEILDSKMEERLALYEGYNEKNK